MPTIRTPEQAHAQLDREGKTIAAFARDHGLDEQTVYQVLSGRKKAGAAKPIAQPYSLASKTE